MAEWGHIVQAITKPLSFASKNDFANLSHVKGLEKLIEGLGHQALSLELGQSQKRLIHELLELFSGFEGSSMEEKRERVARAMRIVTQLGRYRGKVEVKAEAEGKAKTEVEEKERPEVGDKRLEAKL